MGESAIFDQMGRIHKKAKYNLCRMRMCEMPVFHSRNESEYCPVFGKIMVDFLRLVW